MKKKLFTLLLALVAIATTGRAQNKINGHEYVDLGLPSGTLWATCNVGATKPEEYGDYFAWGETEEKSDYSINTYLYWSEQYNSGDNIGEDISGTRYDVAHVKWGGPWKMPTRAQIKELKENCSHEVVVLDGVKGMSFTGINGASIFLPFSGLYMGKVLYGKDKYCVYRTGIPSTLLGTLTYYLYIDNEDIVYCDYLADNRYYRYHGMPIRPVADSSTSMVWHLVTDRGEQFPMSRVGMLVAVDESAYFSVLDINGNVLADEVLRVHFVNSDPVSIENITTEKTQNILKRYVDNELTLVGANGTVNVYSVDGVKMLTIDADGQETVINVSSLPSGVYIVKCGNQSFKFNKK